MEGKSFDGCESSVMEYRRGNRVEIASKGEGFLGSYYGATIVTKLTGNEYIVSYDTLLKEDLTGPLREVVLVDEIRPQPPLFSMGCFNLGDKIDAFDKDGWWMGKIIGRIDKQWYSVYFDYTEEALDYPMDKLRVHQDFVEGKWIS